MDIDIIHDERPSRILEVKFLVRGILDNEQDYDDLIAWCHENCKVGTWNGICNDRDFMRYHLSIYDIMIGFEEEDDAMRFKLVFFGQHKYRDLRFQILNV